MKGHIFQLAKNIPANRLWLVFLRVGISSVAIIHFAALQGDFNDLFSQDSFVSPDISDALKNQLLPSFYSISHVTSKIFGIGYSALLLTVRIVYPIALLSVLVGFLTRFSALLSLLLQLLILNSMGLYTYGADVFTTIGLFYCSVFPVGKDASLDHLLFKKPVITTHLNKFLLIFRIHICLIYFFSGFEKLLGYNWRNGESMWKMVHAYNVLPSVDLDFLARTPLFLIAGWLVIALEMLYPLFINITKTRRTWLWLVVSFHIAIAFFMGLYFFSALMIVFNLTAYYIPFISHKNNSDGPANPDAFHDGPLALFI